MSFILFRPQVLAKKTQDDAERLAQYWPPLSLVAPANARYQFPRSVFHSPRNWPTQFDFVGSGKSKPRIIRVTDNAGRSYKQICKGSDDSRGDSVIQQLFGVINQFLEGSHLRTYKVVPLSPQQALMEWVENTVTFGKWVHGDPGCREGGAHGKYYPNDRKHWEIQVRKKNLNSTGN